MGVRFSTAIVAPAGTPSTMRRLTRWSWSRRLARQPLKVACGALGPLGLQRAPQAKVAGFEVPPAALPVETVIAADGGARHAQVYPNHDIVWRNLWRGRGHDDVQIPAPAPVYKISRRRGLPGARGGIRRDLEWETLPPLYRGQIDHACRPLNAVGVEVIAGRAGARLRARRRTTLALNDQCAFDGRGRLDTRLDVQVADQPRRSSFALAIGGVMQTHAVLFALTPSIRADKVEGNSNLPRRFRKSGPLHGSRVKVYPHRSVHGSI